MQKDWKIQLYGLLAAVVITPSITAYAADRFDGKSSLVCTVHQLHECDAHGGCQLVPEETADDIRHLDFNFSDKSVHTEHWDAGGGSSIDRVETVNNILVIQGMDSGNTLDTDGAGWTVSVNRRYGTMVMTVSGHDVAFIGLGSCITADR